MDFWQIIWLSALAFLTAGIPGFFLSSLLFRRSGLGFPEKLGIGAALGLVSIPLLGWLESFAGIGFSLQLYFLNFIILLLAAFFLCIRTRSLETLPQFRLSDHWPWLVLLLILAFSFFVRLQGAFPTTAGAYPFEYDPYYYTELTRFLLTEGSVPLTDDLAWNPLPPTSHRNPPLAFYLGAQLHYLANNDAVSDASSLCHAQGLYPPLVFVLAVFFAFLLVREYYGISLGLIAASLVAVVPELVKKTAFGLQELTPWSIFSLFFFYASYLLLIKRRTSVFAVLSGIAFASLVLGSKSSLLAALPLAGYVALQAVAGYWQGSLDAKFLKDNLIITSAALLSKLLLSMAYYNIASPFDAITLDLFLLIASLASAALLWLLQKKAGHGQEGNRWTSLVVVMATRRLTRARITGAESVAVEDATPSLPRSTWKASHDPRLPRSRAARGAVGSCRHLQSPRSPKLHGRRCVVHPCS